MSRNENNVEDQLSGTLLSTDNIRQAILEIQDADGIITLRGTVESEQDRLTVETLVRRQDGVVDVINNLRVLPR